jgi:hypothetical protein
MEQQTARRHGGGSRRGSNMSVYTVHAPPLKGDDVEPEPERFVFVRDGFYFWAFLLAPLWLLRHRLWLVLLAYIAVVVALHFGLQHAGASSTVRWSVMMLISLLVGLEAGTLRRFTLSRRGWRNVGLVVGDDRETAERRFFDRWLGRDETVPAPISTQPVWRPQAAPGVIGLFPEPGAPGGPR